MTQVAERIRVVGKSIGDLDDVLSADALSFLAELHDRFNGRREELLSKRILRQREIDAGKLPDFLEETAAIRNSQWTVAEAPGDLQDRRVEITGPVERKMMINALNSGARVFMADFEDSLSPSWHNVVEGQRNLIDAVRRCLEFTNPEGKVYKLNEQTATLVVRPRGWHLIERHVEVDGEPISASLFDFGLYFFHNAPELIERRTAPYFYLPKLESHLEARLWNDVFIYAQEKLNIPVGTIRATVLIETILAAFEMDEILYELRQHASGLNAGRWDYTFSLIKKLRAHKQFTLPDRSQVSMTVPFMRAYALQLVKTCHKRGAHAMGGMAAFIPSRRDAHVNRTAIARVKEDKLREATDGFDGTWVAHPDLVPIAAFEFDRVLQNRPHQKDRTRDDVQVSAQDLLSCEIDGGKITRSGVMSNIDVALQYTEAWLSGIGAAAIHNLMEDAATAEIARAQLWQWIHHGATLEDGSPVDQQLYRQLKDELLGKYPVASQTNHFKEAAEILDSLVLSDEFVDFLTIAAYGYLSDE